MALKKTNEVAAYVRASMDRKGDRWTLETQLKKIRALVEAKDWEIVGVYPGGHSEREPSLNLGGPAVSSHHDAG